MLYTAGSLAHISVVKNLYCRNGANIYQHACACLQSHRQMDLWDLLHVVQVGNPQTTYIATARATVVGHIIDEVSSVGQSAMASQVATRQESHLR
jgi:hypothetical protein